MYASQPWVRQHVGFLPQRTINSYPNTICANGSGKNDTRFHYDENDRDFVVTIPGCEWSGDCWNWMYNYRQYAYWLNRSWWEKFKEDWVAVAWYKLTGHDVKL
jgi:mannan polymerase II complex MNN10 subunit